ncbi:hypothetical protein CHISP_3517 [Chitinispirillum alkaliphilum]|nr:hypothetical protein CHISP_3517 [Chitinispirillum alkaliphilum]
MGETNTEFPNFEDSLKIHAICADNDFSEDDARIFTYMHSKAVESGRGIEYFIKPPPEDSEALEIMLGKKYTLQLPSQISLDEEEKEAVDLIETVAEKISQLDSLLARECGLENRLSGELRSRLRLYKSAEYRDTMIDRYKRDIKPQLPLYDSSRIDQAFKRYQTEKDLEEQKLLQWAGFKKD